jgi:hypothetical protein
MYNNLNESTIKRREKEYHHFLDSNNRPEMDKLQGSSSVLLPPQVSEPNLGNGLESHSDSFYRTIEDRKKRKLQQQLHREMLQGFNNQSSSARSVGSLDTDHTFPSSLAINYSIGLTDSPAIAPLPKDHLTLTSYPFRTKLAEMVNGLGHDRNDYMFLGSSEDAYGKDDSVDLGGHSDGANSPSNLKSSDIRGAYMPVLQEATDIANDIISKVQSVKVIKQMNDVSKINNIENHTKFMNKWKSSLLDELGVNVDPEFSKYRLTLSSVQLFFYYFRSIQITHAFSKWKIWLLHCNQYRMYNAAAFINRVLRGYMARVMVRNIRHHIKLQHEAEIEQEKQRQIFRNYQVVKISRTWKRYKRRKIRKEKQLRFQSAVRIQRRVRGMMGRDRARRYRKFLEKQLSCSVTIQCWWRQILARRKVTIEYITSCCMLLLTSILFIVVNR